MSLPSQTTPTRSTSDVVRVYLQGLPQSPIGPPVLAFLATGFFGTDLLIWAIFALIAIGTRFERTRKLVAYGATGLLISLAAAIWHGLHPELPTVYALSQTVALTLMLNAIDSKWMMATVVILCAVIGEPVAWILEHPAPVDTAGLVHRLLVFSSVACLAQVFALSLEQWVLAREARDAEREPEAELGSTADEVTANPAATGAARGLQLVMMAVVIFPLVMMVAMLVYVFQEVAAEMFPALPSPPLWSGTWFLSWLGF